MKAEPQTAEAGVRLSDFYGHISASIAVGLFLWQATRTGGWFEAAFGGSANLFWVAVAVWLITSVLSVRKRQYWWVIVTAPFAIYPIAMVAVLAGACARGNCL